MTDESRTILIACRQTEVSLLEYLIDIATKNNNSELWRALLAEMRASVVMQLKKDRVEIQPDVKDETREVDNRTMKDVPTTKENYHFHIPGKSTTICGLDVGSEALRGRHTLLTYVFSLVECKHCQVELMKYGAGKLLEDKKGTTTKQDKVVRKRFKCLGCGKVYTYTNKYSDCGNASCEGEKSVEVTE